MKNIFSAFVLMLCSISILQGQLEDYKLEEFEMPFFSNQQLRTDFSFNGNYKSGQVRDTTALFDESVSNNGGFLRPLYFINKNKENYQQNTSIGITFAPSKVKQIYSSNTRVNASLFARSTHRFFYANNTFFQVGGSWNSSYNYSKQLQGGNEFNSSFWNHSLQVPLKWGIGRIHNVTDVWRSIRILKSMEKQGLLTQLPSKEQIQELGDLATNRNQITFFDARLKRIEDYRLLDEWFQSNGLVADRNMAYFNALQDNWIFGANDARNKGKSLSIGISPFLNVLPAAYSTVPYSSSEYQGIWGDLSFEWYKPIHQNLQFDLQASIAAGPTWVNQFFFGNTYEGIIAVPSVQTRLAYFPTTRTGLETNLQMHYAADKEGIVQNNFNELIFNWSNNAYIYFSPQTRLNLNFSLRNGTFGYGNSDFNQTLELHDYKLDTNYSLSFLYYFL